MNRIFAGLLVALLGAAFAAGDADAARLGGGRSLGAQRSIASPPPASAPARQAQQAAPAQTPATAPAAQAAAPNPASKWMPILGGLALGGVLGSLFGGSALAGILMSLVLGAALVWAAMLIARVYSQKRARGLPYAVGSSPGPYAALGDETVAAPPPSQASGLEAYAAAPRAPSVPAGFDVAAFLRAAKLNFMKLQAANDAGDLEGLREFTAPGLYEELKKEALERSGTVQRTDVVSLDAALLEVVTEGDKHWASVRFSGMLRDMPGSAPGGFEEVWNLAKPTDGSTGWVLAGIQQMH